MVISGISSVSGAGSAAGLMGMNQASDSVSKNLLRQIDEAKKKLQELSYNEDLSKEEKMKKRQELQKQISDLDSQLRQHQMELRRKAIEEARKQKSQDSEGENSTDGNRKAGNAGKGQQATGLSQGSMQAMISADGSMKQAKVQGSVAKKMEGKAAVLEAEIKLDAGRGGSTEAKEAELANVKNKAANATASRMDSLSKANETAKYASEEEKGTPKTQEQEKEEDAKAAETEKESEERNFVRYTPVDVRL